MTAPFTPAMSRGRIAALVAAFLLAMGASMPALAQESHLTVTALAWDRPEAWALKYFNSATLLMGMDPPQKRAPWSLSFGAELEWIPPVSAGDRYVGLEGTKQEDLNKTPVYLRPRFIIGLPASFTLIVAFDPPIRAFGVKPKLLSMAIERPVYESGPWSVGLRGYGQIGSVNGDYTCPASVVGYPPGSPQNIYGCQAPSSDTATLRYVGGELSLAHEGLSHWRISPHVSVSVNYFDMRMVTSALTFGFIDSSDLTAHGVTFAGNLGFSYRINRRLGMSLDTLYTPLTISRPTTGRYILPFYNVRALFTYRIR